MAEAANRLDATDYSVLVPAPTSIPGDTPDESVFLCISGPQASKLKWVRVPISSSLCGQSFLLGKAMIASPPSGAFANRTDKIAHFHDEPDAFGLPPLSKRARWRCPVSQQNQADCSTLTTPTVRWCSVRPLPDNSTITDLLNQYFQELCTIAVRHGATIDQFIGDGILLIQHRSAPRCSRISRLNCCGGNAHCFS